MRISYFKLSNYKSFSDSTELKLTPGFNLIIGQNNAGKTALLEALSLDFAAKPHKSLLSKPRPTSSMNPESQAIVEITISGEELKDILSTFNNFNLPMPHRRFSDWHRDPKRLLDDMFKLPEITFQAKIAANAGSRATVKPSRFPSYDLYDCEGTFNKRMFHSVGAIATTSDFKISGQTTGSNSEDFGLAVVERLRQRIYRFTAERFSVSASGFGNKSVLDTNARNLPEVLNVLSSNPQRFNIFNKYVRQIFPSIYQIVVRPNPRAELEIVVWTEDPETQREDLAIELSESGTGVGQVLAILYVAINSDFPRSIIIDEPNTFLHPSAARKLIDILRSIPDHQYIISTHSTEIIGASNPNTLTLVRWEKPHSILKHLDAGQIDDVQKCLIEVGAKLSDVYGADNILWVEGQTEEECFPKILDRLTEYPVLLGTSIVAVKNTGDFIRKRDKSLIIEVYRKVSTGNALLPKAIAFIFDMEELIQSDMADLRRESDNLIHFLPRRTYENYLIHPEALTAIMNTLLTFKEIPLEAVQIREWLINNGGQNTYIENPIANVDIADIDWLEKVNGARLLADMFRELSGSRETYRKTTHSILLTDWLIENDPSSFNELKEFLLSVLGHGS